MTPKAATEVDQTVGHRIAALRKAKGLSQTALGEAVGVTFQQVQKYEKGQNRIGASRLKEIAAFLEVPLSTLFGEGEGEGEAEAGEAEAFGFLAETGAVELLRAYGTIDDAQLRRDVLQIVRTAAKMSAGPVAGNA